MKRHGFRYHPLYVTWVNINSRCNNKKRLDYKYYGGRGISVCKEWSNEPLAFILWSIENGWRNGLTIDRKNVDGNYSPSNCRFVTMHQQSLNRRVFKSNKSGITGVCFDKESGRWLAYVSINKKQKKLGRFKTKIQAVRARNKFIPITLEAEATFEKFIEDVKK